MKAARIRDGMPIVGSCGACVGKVDLVEDHCIRLAYEDAEMHEELHFIPLKWVRSVDSVVHLDRPFHEVVRGWETAALISGG